MSFLGSILFGNKGSYNIFGFPVEFKNEQDTLPSDCNCQNQNFSKTSRSVSHYVLCMITQIYVHLLVHEMGHVIVLKMFTEKNAKMTFYPDRTVNTPLPPGIHNLSDTIFDIAGSVSDIAFSIFKMIAITRLKNYLPWPISLFLKSGVIICISAELLRSFIITQDQCDFGRIAKRSQTHLVFARIVIISEVALGIFLAKKLGVLDLFEFKYILEKVYH